MFCSVAQSLNLQQSLLLLGGFGPFNTCCLLLCSYCIVHNSGSSLCADLEEESVQYGGEFEVCQQIDINCFVSQICNY